MKYLLHHNFTWEEEGTLSRSYQHHVSTYMSEVGLVKTEEVDIPLVKVERSSGGSRKFIVHSNVSRLSYCEDGQDVDVETCDDDILGNPDVVVDVGSIGEKTVTIAPSKEHDYCSLVYVHSEPQDSKNTYDSVCGEQFPPKLSFEKHRRRHKSRHQCTQCDKSFNFKSLLVEHERIHTDDRPFACAFCTKTFKHKKDCKRHMRTHTGERPFKCTDCEKSFICSGNLADHRSVHTDRRPFCCHLCGKTFKRLGDVRKHSKICPSKRSQETKTDDLVVNMDMFMLYD